jgi:ABC-type glycerol-3-phosphate transport system substrate-binding protein
MASKVLKVWILPFTEETMELVIAYYEKHLKSKLDFDVEWSYLPWNIGWREITRALKTGRGPDVFQLGSTWVNTIAQMGYLAPVPQDLADRPVLAPWVKETSLFCGREVAVPFIVEVMSMFARMDLLEEAGLDIESLRDWHGFLNACIVLAEKAKQDPHYKDINFEPYIFSCHPETTAVNHILYWMYAAGWEFPDFKRGRQLSLLDNGAVMDTMEYLKEICVKSGISPDRVSAPLYTMHKGFFDDGSQAFHIDINTKAVMERLKKDKVKRQQPFDFKILPLPSGKRESRSIGSGSYLCVNSSSRNISEAWELIRGLVDDKFYRMAVEHSGALSPFVSDFWKDLDHDEDLINLRRMAGDSISFPPHPLWAAAQQYLKNGITELAWHFVQGGGYDARAKEIADNTDRKINELIDFMWGVTHV